jgi:hypothetical protein
MQFSQAAYYKMFNVPLISMSRSLVVLFDYSLEKT